MKKTITLLLSIFILAGCANDQYATEKLYWKLQKQAGKIFNNPAGSPPKELEKAVKALNNFAAKFSKNSLSVDADFTIARLYMVKKEYDKARSHLKGLLDKYNKSKEICAETVFLIGNSFELQDKWESALEQYKNIIQKYAVTRRGMDAPVYIAQHYKVVHQPEKMIAAFGEAIAHYNSLAKDNPDTVLAYSASMLAANCYAAMKDWTNTISSLNTIIEKYKGKINADGILMNIAMIYSREVKDKIKAKETLQRLVNEYPKSKLAKTATALLEEMAKNE
jgi:TolA-binding protein